MVLPRRSQPLSDPTHSTNKLTSPTKKTEQSLYLEQATVVGWLLELNHFPAAHSGQMRHPPGFVGPLATPMVTQASQLESPCAQRRSDKSDFLNA